jgi:hypothetical protein
MMHLEDYGLMFEGPTTAKGDQRPSIMPFISALYCEGKSAVRIVGIYWNGDFVAVMKVKALPSIRSVYLDFPKHAFEFMMKKYPEAHEALKESLPAFTQSSLGYSARIAMDKQ